jgi:DNA polymerase III epsilon subunit-like protein
MRALDATIVVIDFETTGVVEGYADEPWQIGMARVARGRLEVEGMYASWLRVGDRPFNLNAPGRHREVRGELAVAPTLQELWPGLRGWWLEAPMAAHNAATEKRVIAQAAPLHRPRGWIDTLKLARVAYPRLASHTLTDLLEGLGLRPEVERLCPGRTAHDALYDAVGCGVLLLHLLSMDGWRDASVQALQTAHPARYYRVRGRS